jgi:hypothetical protein
VDQRPEPLALDGAHHDEQVGHEPPVAREPAEQGYRPGHELVGPHGVDAEERRIGEIECRGELAEHLLQHDGRVDAVRDPHVRRGTGALDAHRHGRGHEQAQHALECREARFPSGERQQVSIVDDAETFADLAGDEHLAPADELVGHHRTDAHGAFAELEGAADSEAP